MAEPAPRMTLSQATLYGAGLGSAITLLNAYFAGTLGQSGLAEFALVMAGGAFGGAVLFLGVLGFMRLLRRRLF
ncbi:MAG: hypothetical protein IT529_15910 [Burkholderiales bacterium]|nr:hypothetical protein [Burkholderiales bacterium]